MTLQERLIVSAYTGVTMCDFAILHEYLEKLLERPIYTHELADEKVVNEIREKVKPDFIALCGNE